MASYIYRYVLDRVTIFSDEGYDFRFVNCAMSETMDFTADSESDYPFNAEFGSDESDEALK